MENNTKKYLCFLCCVLHRFQPVLHEKKKKWGKKNKKWSSGCINLKFFSELIIPKIIIGGNFHEFLNYPTVCLSKLFRLKLPHFSILKCVVVQRHTVVRFQSVPFRYISFFCTLVCITVRHSSPIAFLQVS